MWWWAASGVLLLQGHHFCRARDPFCFCFGWPYRAHFVFYSCRAKPAPGRSAGAHTAFGLLFLLQAAPPALRSASSFSFPAAGAARCLSFMSAGAKAKLQVEAGSATGVPPVLPHPLGQGAAIHDRTVVKYDLSCLCKHILYLSLLFFQYSLYFLSSDATSSSNSWSNGASGIPKLAR